MRNVTTSTIVSLLYAKKLDVDFRSYVSELETALQSSDHENFSLTWEYDDFAVFDIDGSRVVAACSNTLRDRSSGQARSGDADATSDDEGAEYTDMMLLAVGYGLKTGASTLVADHREEICRSVVSRIQHSNPPDLVLWRTFDHPFTPEDFDQLILELPHRMANAETQAAETIVDAVATPSKAHLLSDLPEDLLWQRCDDEFLKQGGDDAVPEPWAAADMAPETEAETEAEAETETAEPLVASTEAAEPETVEEEPKRAAASAEPDQSGTPLSGESGPADRHATIWTRVAETKARRKPAPRPQTIRLSPDEDAPARRSERPGHLSASAKPKPLMLGLEPPRPQNLRTASTEWEVGSRPSLERPGPLGTSKPTANGVANDTPDIPAPMLDEMEKLRSALYFEEKPKGFHFGPAVKAPLPQRLTTYTFNATLLVVALPVGAALLTYNVLGREDLGVTARAMALTGAAIGFAQSGYGDILLRFI